jgi:hypothetical protein
MRTRLIAVSIATLTIAACGPGNNGTASSNNGQNGSQNASTNGQNGATNAATNSASNQATNSSTSTNAVTNSNAETNNAACDELDPPLGDCDPICQTGCDVGDHCIATGDPLEAICEGAGVGAQGEECSADTECGVGLHCRAIGQGPQICTAYCDPTVLETGCPPDHACNRLVADMRIGACVEIEHRCDAVPEDSCADPEECYDTLNGRRCVEAGDTALNEPCTRSTDCAVGLRCVGVDGMGEVCRQICDPNGDAGQCPDGETCRALRNQQGDDLTWGACY